jgi:putative transposase
MNDSSCVFDIIYKTLQINNNCLSVRCLCSIAGVSRSGYYAWIKAAPIREIQEERDRKDFDLILSVYKKRGYKKGAQSIYMGLLHLDPPVVMNIKKIRRLMCKYNLVCPIRKANPYRLLAKALKKGRAAENLLNRQFEDYGPRMVLLTDITYLPYNGTFAYLSTILDAFTKQILSYVLSASLAVDFVLETIRQLIRDHGFSLHAETIIHSDQGSHYTSCRFIEIVKDKQLRQSMSRRGCCWDNAPQESFFGHMKDHIKDKLKNAAKYSEVKAIVDDYMDYYNDKRSQWQLAKLTPNEFYKFVTTGSYPLDIPNAPAVPSIKKTASGPGKAEPTDSADKK